MRITQHEIHSPFPDSGEDGLPEYWELQSGDSLPRRFSAVEGGALYRSRVPLPFQVQTLKTRFQVRTIMPLLPLSSSVLETFAQIDDDEMQMHHFPFNRRHDVNLTDIRSILELLKDEQNLPALICCKKGTDRTGMVAAAYEAQVLKLPLWKSMAHYIGHAGFNISTMRDIQQYSKALAE